MAIIENQSISTTELTSQDKVISLYKFIKELNTLKQKAILSVSDYPWSCSVRDIPVDPQNIKIFFRDRVEDESTDENSTLLSVHKPEFQKCPMPDELLKEWIFDGWISFRNPVRIRESIVRDKNGIEYKPKQSKKEQLILFDSYMKSDEFEEETTTEHFNDSESRIKVYEKWAALRNVWVEKQKIIEKTRDFFTNLYKIHIDLERDSETLELVVANGFIRDRDESAINHPVLTRRVKIRFDAVSNTIFIEDTDVETELYSMLFQMMININIRSIISLRDDLHKNDYHPMDRNNTPEFLKILIHQLSSESLFSDDGEPENWKYNNRLLLYMNPTFIVRKRVDGTLKLIEYIIENIENTGEIPGPLVDIVSGGKIDIPEDDGEETVEEQLAAVGGESIDILLSKEANKEQLEIARRIEYYNAVLVQGPPGTGKTHTIANLMGHFLAKGKSVLVTSHTQKALSVLKDKVASGLQSLCVSILDDSNADMEKSVDGITDYMSRFTSFEIKKQMDILAQERRMIIDDLADTRKKLFAIINQECNCIVFNGEDISPSKAAAFVLEHAEELSYIPGNVRLHAPLPLSFDELNDLYRSNERITLQDEPELTCGLPNPELILSPDTYVVVLEILQSARKRIDSCSASKEWRISNKIECDCVEFETDVGNFKVAYPEKSNLDSLKAYISSFGSIEDWMKFAAVDGKKGGAFKQRWLTLIYQIQKTCEYAESIVTERFGKEIRFVNKDNLHELIPNIEKLKNTFAKKNKISKLDMLINKSFEETLGAVTINGAQIQSAEDCEIILHSIELENIRKQCAVYWDKLLASHDVPSFFDLDASEPERIAQKWVQLIQRYLNWYQQEYTLLSERIAAANIPVNVVFAPNTLDSDVSATDKILSSINNLIPTIIDVCYAARSIQTCNTEIKNTRYILQLGKRIGSNVCANVVRAIDTESSDAYGDSFRILDVLFAKYDLQQKRNEMLKIMEPVAPQWVNAIKSREGIHGSNTVPSTIEDAWKWKQLSGIIAEITAEPFEELQANSLSLSKNYRKTTAQFAEKSAWYHLLRKTERDIDMKHALQGWKQTVKRIGKGTGKNAPMYKAKARELMAKCQVAVPGWIMPIGRAMENLDPRTNSFDIIIIDEASQSDISALAVLYMGKKFIIVGDDKQVSPMAVGMEVEKMNKIEQTYIKDKIPNSHLYNAKTSIYDIAATTFQPLMLREHFRCVPEIIGFSNALSYDYKIKPLRDAGDSRLLPAVVNYRVADGEREGKTNVKEAMTIVSLIKACMDQPEYASKTFGVISMLGDEQVKKMQSFIDEKIETKESAQRRILCGNASNFQGDERDVIFLSLVDSNTGTGPLNMQNFGSDDTFRKRYNVAASRARDQLWVVDSLDTANDLKHGDIRKRLIEYSINPASAENLNAEVEEKAESPLESSVAKALVNRGYHLVQQWKVGAYRLDMVAVYGKQKVAIECDGERWHSGEAKIREDMERQTILERIRWRFIRIRGSEYYRNPDKAIERVVSELTRYGIEPEAQIETVEDSRTSDLLQRVKAKAASILNTDFGETGKPIIDIETIGAALSNNGKPISDTQSPKIDVTAINPINKPNNILRPTAESQTQKNETPVQPKQKRDRNQPQVVNPVNGSHHSPNVTTRSNKQAEQNTAVRKKKEGNSKPSRTEPVSLDAGNTGDAFIHEIANLGYKFIDNRKLSKHVWILYFQEIKESVESILQKYKYQYELYKRGPDCTNGKPAWRIII